jgi:hypothetical protein
MHPSDENPCTPNIIRQTLLAKRALLVEERFKLDADIAAIDAFLNPDRPTTPQAMAFAIPMKQAVREASIGRQIIDFAAKNISPDVSMTTEKIYHLMVVNGAKFPQGGKSAQSRITRTISGTGLYKGHKTNGWSLKGETPVGAGVSIATKSLADEL